MSREARRRWSGTARDPRRAAEIGFSAEIDLQEGLERLIA
jgi:hypothetical protein